MLLKDEINSMIRQLSPELIQVRRHIHMHPELSFHEYKTSEFIQHKLREAGIEFKAGVVKTGIVALIRGKNPGKKTILLRADMDALPIEEKNDVEYKSQNQGIMHACGHDVHSACALGAALVLHKLRDRFEGTVKVIFQPGEELLPGGAKLMIDEGVLEDPKVEQAIALHVFPGMEAGRVGFRKGVYMASTDELYITVHGKGGHAAMPADYKNPIIAASDIVLEINETFLKEGALKSTPGENIPTVVAIGKFEASGATNVIPDRVELAGTIRTFDESWRNEIHRRIREIIMDVSDKNGVRSELRIEHGYPVLKNDPDFTASCMSAAQTYLGDDKVEELPLRMTAEDFSFISQRVPSCFFRLGVSNTERGIVSGVHTPTFDVDESAIPVGAGLMTWLALSALGA